MNKLVIVYICDVCVDMLVILCEEKVMDCGGVLYCFIEDREMVGKLLDFGFYIFFFGIVIFCNVE